MIPHAYYASLKRHFQQHKWLDKKIVATVSGGADSMALCYVLQTLEVEFVIAHCNFHLRGEDSNGDEAFVEAWAAEHKIPFYVKSFDTLAIQQPGENLEDLCRRLRYEWFETLRMQLGYHLIMTAHHKYDSVETVLMNLMKGTGIAGLHGIAPEKGYIARPLLDLEKTDLIHIIEANEGTWREDYTNATDDFLRNKIRHHLLPLMNEIVPQATHNIHQTSKRIADIEQIYLPKLEQLKQQFIEQRGMDYYIPILKLQKQEGYKTILWEIVKAYGFSAAQLEDIVVLLDAHTGKFVASTEYRIIKNRDMLIITRNAAQSSEHILIQENDTAIALPHFTLHFSDTPTDDAQSITVAKNKLVYPLVLRPKKEGDYFYPNGMGMKKKKISKLLKDLKIPMHEKEQIWILQNGDEKVIWVLGLRMDERFVAKEKDEVIYIAY